MAEHPFTVLTGGRAPRRRAWYERLPPGLVILGLAVLGWIAVAGFVGFVYALLRVWWP
jgi:hypothetical protein